MSSSSSLFLYPKLSNCYIPLRQIEGVEDGSSTNNDSRPTKRTKHNDSDATRPTSDSNGGERMSSDLDTMKINVIPNADGSSSVECFEEGSTKVICAVHGPRDISLTTSTQQQHSNSGEGGTNEEGSTSLNAFEKGSLVVKVKFASTFAVSNQTIATQMASSSTTLSSSNNLQYHRKHMLEEMEFEFETKIYNAIVGSIPLELYPKSSIEVCIQVLECFYPQQTLAACIHSAILALVDAGIECKYLVTCSTVVVGVAAAAAAAAASLTDSSSDDNNKKEPNISYLIDSKEEEEFNDKHQKYQPIMSITLAMGLTFDACCSSSSDTNETKKQQQQDKVVQMIDEYVTLWEQQSLQQTKNSVVGLTSKQCTKAMELLRSQCHKIHQHLVDVLMIHYKNDQESNSSN